MDFISFDAEKDARFYFAAGVCAKQFRLPADSVILKHAHDYYHMSILAAGRVAVTLPHEQQIYDAPACIEIKAGAVHQIQALTDAVWFCIHPDKE